MSPLLVVAGLAVALVDGGLLVLAWRRRAVLSAVAGAAGLGSGLFAALWSGGPSGDGTLLAAALAVGVLGWALLVIGQAVQRLLDQSPEREP